MPKLIELPVLAADIESGVIESWAKGVGDRVAVGDVLLEVSTDKAVVEVEADTAGTLGEILVPAGGEEVAVHTPIAVLLLEGESDDALEAFDYSSSSDSPDASDSPSSRASKDSESGEKPRQPSRASPPQATTDGRLRVSPSARHLARKIGVDLQEVDGSGPRGRIVRGDIVIASREESAHPETSEERRPIDTRIENDRVRKVIARKLTAAKQEIPHFYLEIDFRVDNLLAMRKRLNSIADDAYHLSVNDMIAKAVAASMRDCPEMNRTWEEESTVQYGSVDISIAVDSPTGLMTPVLRDADSKRLSQMSNECRALIERARGGRLQPDEFRGGGITVSNLGMFGIRSFTAIINPPQASILAVGAARRTTVFDEDSPVVATMMACTLSVDHRVIDGATAARFLNVLGKYLEEPERLLKGSI